MNDFFVKFNYSVLTVNLISVFSSFANLNFSFSSFDFSVLSYPCRGHEKTPHFIHFLIFLHIYGNYCNTTPLPLSVLRKEALNLHGALLPQVK